VRATPASTPSTKKSTRLTFASSVVISIACGPTICEPDCGETKVTEALAVAARKLRSRNARMPPQTVRDR
jgi:hypothetical protein